MSTIFDLFCGTGGFSHGIKTAVPRLEVRLGVDVLPIAIQTFKANNTLAIGISKDIRRLRRSEVSDLTGLKRGELDVVVGGPPCQGFSSIRPFRSVNDDDPRNSLFEEFASFVNYFRPRLFVIENVVGLATHKNGETLQRMSELFHSLQYDCDWRILNCAQYGVAQKRERLIFVGVERGGKFVFPKPLYVFRGQTIGHKNRARMSGNVGRDLFSEALPEALTVMEAIGDLPCLQSGESGEQYDSEPTNEFQALMRDGSKNLTLHEATNHSKRMLEIIRHSGKNISSIPEGLISSGFSSSYSRLAADEPSVTITVNFVHPASNRCIHPTQDRALTPREGARLQSFKDGYIFCGNRSQITKQIGNAVPPLLGAAIGDSVREALAL